MTRCRVRVDEGCIRSAFRNEVLRKMSCKFSMNLKRFPPVVLIGSSKGGKIWQVSIRKVSMDSFDNECYRTQHSSRKHPMPPILL